MIRLFKKKKTPAPAPEPIEVKTPCELFGHIWQDFPWYLEESYDKNREYKSEIDIIEPYVCRRCHARKNITLSTTYEDCSRSKHDEKVEQFKKEYAEHLKPMPVVIDMINDMILVDRDMIKIWEKLRNEGEK